MNINNFIDNYIYINCEITNINAKLELLSIILVIGLAHYMEGEDYVITELRNRQINKADLLIEFKNTYDNKKYLYAEEEQLIKEHLEEKPKEIKEKEISEQELVSIGLTD